MAMVKICPSCGAENPISEIMCCDCMMDISGVVPSDPEAQHSCDAHEQKNVAEGSHGSVEAGATIIDRRASLRFELNGDCFSAADGDEIGREKAGASCLSSFSTVSRRHARIFNEGNLWRIEDLNSTNGTWVNEVRLANGERREIKDGDSVALSRSCILKVKGH